MSTRVRSYAKVNLGLAIGPVREDGFHGLVTLYQTLDLHDLVTVSVRRGGVGLTLTSNDRRVPCDAHNTAWRMVEWALERMGIAAEVTIHIEKKLPIQGGMGAGSANAAAALIALEVELGEALPEDARLALAADVGSDVPLFLVGGAVLGTGRGEIVEAAADFPATACVVAIPTIGVSTPAAFREWDARYAAGLAAAADVETEVAGWSGVVDPLLTFPPVRDTLNELSRVYADILVGVAGSTGIVRNPLLEKQQDGMANGLAENTLLELVRTGIENDFEEVVFSQHPSLREIKRQLMGSETETPALYAALSGSGSALFGLYESTAAARVAQQRLQSSGIRALATETLPRTEYWGRMVAE
jgi:4-diphosphocytidyl-2-C-methyl-D-erythritol kinase